MAEGRVTPADQQVAPPLSVIVATVHPWPELKACLDRLLPQIRACGAEFIVADSTGQGVGPGHPDVRVVVEVGASVFALRAAAARQARGAVIAFTEDHCLVAPDWCQRVLAAHAEHPEIGLIAGCVNNGSTTRLMDWANFLVTFAPFMPPFLGDIGSRVPPPANVSVKRSHLHGDLSPGDLEISIPERLRGGGLIRFDESIRVSHVQSHGFLGTLTQHYHNGRASMGLALDGRTRVERLSHRRVVLRALPEMAGTVIRNVVKRRRALPWKALLSLPLVVVVVIAHTIGGAIGSTQGPGRSPLELI